MNVSDTRDCAFEAFVTNLGKYNEGFLVGEWVKFPVTNEEMQAIFRRIGIGRRYEECEAAGYVSVQQQGEDLFHLQKIYVLPYYQGAHCGSFLFREAIKYIKEVHPGPCLMELNVNRHNKALQFYEHMGMRKLREGDFPIGNGYYMNDYIMGLDI